MIRLRAAASDPDGTIVAVHFVASHFYEGTNLLGTVTQPPYNLFLTNALRDSYSPYYLTASATDNQGASSTSAPVQIYVLQDIWGPLVFITEPKDGDALLYPAAFSISARVDNADGSENPARFYSGTNLIGTVDSPPYTLVLTNLGIGEHLLTVDYTDNFRSKGTSQKIRIRLSPLRLSDPQWLPDRRFQFTVGGLTAGAGFEIQASTNLLNWSSLGTNQATSSTFIFAEAFPATNSQRFYRAFLRPE